VRHFKSDAGRYELHHTVCSFFWPPLEFAKSCACFVIIDFISVTLLEGGAILAMMLLSLHCFEVLLEPYSCYNRVLGSSPGVQEVEGWSSFSSAAVSVGCAPAALPFGNALSLDGRKSNAVEPSPCLSSRCR
jgi:hypothetical protein